MKKRILIIAAILVIAGIAVSAEGEQEQENGGGPTKIIYYTWDDPTYPEVIAKFNSSQDEVIVEPIYLPAREVISKMTTMLAAGQEMDAYGQYRTTNIFTENANGYIQPLDDLIKKHNFNKTFSEFTPSTKEQITIDGQVVALPFRDNRYYTYYNRVLFEEAGIPTPDTYVKNGEWTWEKYTEVAKKLSSGDGNLYGGLLYTWAVQNVFPVVQRNVQLITNDGNLDIDETSVLYSYHLRKELEESKAIMPLIEIKVTKTHYSKPFYAGEVAMLCVGDWFPGMMKKAKEENYLQGFTWNDWGITRLPCNEETYRTAGYATFNHVHANSKKKDAAFKFISWMSGPEGAVAMAQAGFLPPLSTPEVKNALSEVIPDKESLEYFTEGAPEMPVFYNIYGQQIKSGVNALMEEYLVQDMSDSELMERLEKRLTEIIKTTN